MSGYCRIDGSAPLEDAPAESTLRMRLRGRLKEQPYPLFCFAEGTIPAASIWTGSRLWVSAFRESGLAAGDRLVLNLPPSAAWLQVMVAAAWEGLTLVLAPPTSSPDDLFRIVDLVDARAAIVDDETAGACGHEAAFGADWCSGPTQVPIALRKSLYPPTPNVPFLFRTSGTTGAGRWIALSEQNVLSVIDSHQPRLGLEESDSRVLSVLPWHHSFGFVLDLLPALFAGCEIHRCLDGGRSVAHLLLEFASAGITHMSMVPLTVHRLLRAEGGPDFLRSLVGGVVGGAPLDSATCEFLRSTNLRVGYGQTEASPGICLGKPGHFPVPYYLGEPVGCEIRVDAATNTLQFRGENACAGSWIPGAGFQELPVGRWQDTGDIVRRDDGPNGSLAYVARVDDSFKLANGRFVAAGIYEARIRESCHDATENLMLFSRNGENLEVASDAALCSSALATGLGSMNASLSAVHTVSPELFVRTNKGCLDRRATAQRLCQITSAA